MKTKIKVTIAFLLCLGCFWFLQINQSNANSSGTLKVKGCLGKNEEGKITTLGNTCSSGDSQCLSNPCNNGTPELEEVF